MARKEEIGELSVKFSAESKGFKRDVGGARRELSGFSREAKGADVASNRFGGTVRGITPAVSALSAATFAGATAFAAFSVDAVRAAADLETVRTSFETMLGSAEKAKDFVDVLNEFSTVTPFEPTEIFQAAKALTATGMATEEISAHLQFLGDAAAGGGAKIGELATIFAKMRNTGKVTLETLNQLAERNIPIFAKLAENLGVSRKELSSMISAGKVGIPDVTAAMDELNDSGEIFSGAMEKQSKTLNGMMSTLKGNMENAKAAFGEGLSEAGEFKELMSSINDLVKSTDWKGWGKSAGNALTNVKSDFKELQMGLMGAGQLLTEADIEIRMAGKPRKEIDAAKAAARSSFRNQARQMAEKNLGIDKAANDAFVRKHEERIARERSEGLRRRPSALGDAVGSTLGRSRFAQAGAVAQGALSTASSAAMGTQIAKAIGDEMDKTAGNRELTRQLQSVVTGQAQGFQSVVNALNRLRAENKTVQTAPNF